MGAIRPSLFAAHPWHGVHPGENAPEELTAYVEEAQRNADIVRNDKVFE